VDSLSVLSEGKENCGEGTLRGISGELLENARAGRSLSDSITYSQRTNPGGGKEKLRDDSEGRDRSAFPSRLGI